MNSSSPSCVADVLARKAAGDKFDWLKIVNSAFSDISKSLHAWPMFFKDTIGIIINLNLPSTLKARTFKPQVNSTYPRK